MQDQVVRVKDELPSLQDQVFRVKDELVSVNDKLRRFKEELAGIEEERDRQLRQGEDGRAAEPLAARIKRQTQKEVSFISPALGFFGETVRAVFNEPVMVEGSCQS